MKKIFTIMTIAALTFASCSKDNVKEINMGRAIDFRTSVRTKAQTLTATLSSFYVTALTEEEESYFTNVLFTYDGESCFKSSQDYYWPAAGSLHFYAYAPVSMKESITIDGDTKMLYGYVADDNISNQKDLLIGKASGNKEDNEINGVAISMNHILSQVELRGVNTNDAYVYKIKAVRIYNVAKGGDCDFSVVYNWKNLVGTYNPASSDEPEDTEEPEGADEPAAAESSESSEVEMTPYYEISYGETPKTLSATSISLMSSDNDNAMLIPHSTAGWDVENDAENKSNGSYVSFLVQINTKDGLRIFPRVDEDEDGKYDDVYGWTSKPMNFKWQPGFKYTYTFDFSDGAGVLPPDNPENPGGNVLGGQMSFDIEFVGWEWNSYYDTY